MDRITHPRLLGFIIGVGVGHFVQLTLNNGQPLRGNDGIVGSFFGGIAGATVAYIMVRLRGTRPPQDQPPG